MKLSIDARVVNLYKGYGIVTYTENVLKEMLLIESENEYYIFLTGDNYQWYQHKNKKIIYIIYILI